MTKIIMAILCSLSLLCHAADPMLIDSEEQSEQTTAMNVDTEPMDIDIVDPITLISNDQKFVVPKEIAVTFSEYIKNKIELAELVNQATEIITFIKPVTPETLSVIISLMTEAHKILIDKPISAQGSYVELSTSPVLNGLNTEQLLQTMHAGIFLLLDERIQKAIALKIAHYFILKYKHANINSAISNMVVDIDTSAQEFVPTVRSTILPYIVQQHYLLTNSVGYKSHDFGDGISVRDLLVHNKMPPIEFSRLNLEERHIGSLDGLSDIPNINQIVRLMLSYNQLTSLEPGVFNHLNKLEMLDLSDNQLTSLKPGIFDGLNQLQSLNLKNTQLALLEPSVFNHLNKLQILSLSSNRLTSLELGIFDGLNNLGVLNLADNQLTSLEPGVFDGLNQLRLLDLSYNQLTSLKPDIFDGLNKLELLHVSNNQLTSLEWGVFNHLNQLLSLDLSNNQLTSLEEPDISFDGLKQLDFLYLGNNPLNDETKHWIKEYPLIKFEE